MELDVISSGPVVQETHRSVPLEDLARQIRAHLKAVQVAASNALDAALSAGENLIAAQARVPDGRWKGWLRENCSIAVSTAALYMQLARARSEIEAEISRAGELSIRAARKLIAKKPAEDESPETEPEESKELEESKAPDPVAAVLAGLQALTSKQATAVWAEYGLGPFLKTMPPTWCTELERRIAGLRSSKKGRGPVLLRESEVLRSALGQVRIVASPEATPVDIELAENQALTALRTLAVALADVDIDSITIVNQHAKEVRSVEGRAKRGKRGAA